MRLVLRVEEFSESPALDTGHDVKGVLCPWDVLPCSLLRGRWTSDISQGCQWPDNSSGLGTVGEKFSYPDHTWEQKTAL